MFDEIISPLFTTEWGRRVVWGMMIGMLLLFITTFLVTILQWQHDYQMTRNQKQLSLHQLTQGEVAQFITQIPEYHLFGQYGTQNVALPITSLQLHLVGIIKAETDQFSQVIISEGGQPGKVYHIGDRLPSGVEIQAITSDGVVLENGGHLEKLPLQRSPLLFQGMPKPLLRDESMEN